jgi:class 3 adenylate cyclase/tetratricopeptide (TPR) repeat protein
MTFEEIVDQAIEMVRRRGQVSYRMLKRQFALDDAGFEDLKDEILYSQSQIVDDAGRGFAWTGDTAPEVPVPPASVPTSAPGADQQPLPISYTPQYLTEKIMTSRSALEGERKQVTVLFADIKDSTELIRDLDPEDAQKLLDPAIHIMMEAVHRFEGTVNQVLGDGIMSIFGAPIAHEDHAARACYAALAMQSAMRDYTDEVRRSRGLTLRIRVGLNSGEVVVRTIGNDLHMDYSAVGQTTNLASRMEQLADPGRIILTAPTLRLVEGLVQVNHLGPIPIKGMTEPVEVYELTGASSVRRRLQAAVARGLTKFVGRDIEIEALNQALEQAGTGHGQIVAAMGEAGVGKSRLMYEFVHSHRTQGWLGLESASVSYGKATPYFPVLDLLKRYVHVGEGDDPRTIRAKVTGQILTLDASLQETIPALLSLLDALPEDNPFLQLDPPQRRQRTLDGLKQILLRESQVQPLVLVFEDLHWIDSETQALLDSLVENLSMAQLLLLVNYRPGYQHNWGSKTYYTQLRLDPLPPESAGTLLEVLLGDDSSLEPLKKLLIERTEGNPFFLEESVRTLVETQALVGKLGVYRLSQAVPMIQVPATVQAVLAARIDRLPQEAKGLLQTASVIGNEVPFTLLQAIAEIPDETLHPGLTHLQAAEFLYETSLFPERVYTFKHALTHDVAYNTLLQERRRRLHARIVEVLETLAGDRLTEQVDRLAHHAFRGEVWDKALSYCRQAAEKAREQSAYHETVGYFEHALGALQHLPESRETREQAIDLRFLLSMPLMACGESGRGFSYLREAEALAQALVDQRRLGEVLVQMTRHFRMLGDYDNAIESGQRGRAIAIALGDFPLQVMANAYLGQVHHAVGEYRQAIDFLRQNVASLAGNLRYARFQDRTSPAVISYARLIWCQADLGAFAEGIPLGEEGIRIAEVIDIPYGRIVAYSAAGYLWLRKGDLSKAIPILERGLHLCQEAHIYDLLPRSASALGAAYALSERLAAALPLLEHGMEQAASTGNMGSHALWLASLGEAYLFAGRQADALALTERALALARAHKERGSEAYTLQILGAIHAHCDPPDTNQAENYYQQALALANELGMRPLQAHCHRGLGTLYRQAGQSEQARAELSTAISMYRDMEMTFWLPQAEVALEKLTS